MELYNQHSSETCSRKSIKQFITASVQDKTEEVHGFDMSHPGPASVIESVSSQMQKDKGSIMQIEISNNLVLAGAKRLSYLTSKHPQGRIIDNRMKPILIEQTEVEIPLNTIDDFEKTQQLKSEYLQQDEEAPGEEAKGSDCSINEFDPTVQEFKNNTMNIKNPYVGHQIVLQNMFDHLRSGSSSKLSHQMAGQNSIQELSSKTQASKVMNIESLKQKTNSMMKSQGLGHSKYMVTCAVVSKSGKKPPSAFINAKSPNQNSRIQKAIERPGSALMANEEAVHKQLEQRKNSQTRYVALLDKVFMCTTTKKPKQITSSGQKQSIIQKNSSTKTGKQSKSPTKRMASPIGRFKLQNIKNVIPESRNQLSLNTEGSQTSLHKGLSKKQMEMANKGLLSMTYLNSKRGRNGKCDGEGSQLSHATMNSKKTIQKQDQTDLNKPQIIVQTKSRLDESKLSINHDKFELLLTKNTFSLPTKSSLNKQTRPDPAAQSKSSVSSQKLENGSMNSSKFIRKKSEDGPTHKRKSPVDMKQVSKQGTTLFSKSRRELELKTSNNEQAASKVQSTKNHTRLLPPSSESSTIPNRRTIQTRQVQVTKSTVSTKTKRSTADQSEKVFKTSKDRIKFLSPQPQFKIDAAKSNLAKAAGDVEKPLNRNASRSSKRSKFVSPIPAGGGLIQKSKDLLKNLFEFQFFPIVQEILKREANEQLIMMLETKNELVHFEDKFKSKDFLFLGRYAKDSEMPTDFKAHEMKIKIAYRSLSLRLKMENVEEVLVQMGFIRQGEASDIQDKLDFIRLWEILYKTQIKYDCNKSRRGKRKSLPEVYRKNIDVNQDEVISISSDTESDLSDNYFKSSKAVNCSKNIIFSEQTVQVRILEKALLNVVGIWKTRPKLYREFLQLKDNYESWYQQQYKQQSVNAIIKSHITEINRSKIEESRNQKRLAQESGARMQVNTGGYFGAPDKPIRQEPEILVRVQENNPKRINDQFVSLLRSSEPMSKTRPSSKPKQIRLEKSPKRKQAIKTKAQKDLQKLQQIIDIQNNEIMSINDALSINLPTSFSLKSISAQNLDTELTINQHTMKSENCPPVINLCQSQTPDMKTAVLNFELKQRQLAMHIYHKGSQETCNSLPQSQRDPQRLPELQHNSSSSNIEAEDNASPMQTVMEKADQPNMFEFNSFENVSYTKLNQKKQEFMRKMEEQMRSQTPSEARKRRMKSVDFNAEEKSHMFTNSDNLYEPRRPTPILENFRTQNTEEDEVNSDADINAETGGTSQYTVTTEKKQFMKVIEHYQRDGEKEMPAHKQIKMQTLEDITKLEIQINEVQQELNRQMESKVLKRGTTPLQVRFNLPENGEIKEEIREDSMDEESEENDFINKVLRTSDCNDLLHLDSDELLFDNNLTQEEEKKVEEEVRQNQRNHSRQSKKETIMAELKSEAECFIKMQNIKASDRGSSSQKEVEKLPQIVSPTLFKMEEDQKIESIESHLRRESGIGKSSARSVSNNSGKRKFVSKIPGKNLEPKEQKIEDFQQILMEKIKSENQESSTTIKGSQSSRLQKIDQLTTPKKSEMASRKSGGQQSTQFIHQDHISNQSSQKNLKQSQRSLPPKKKGRAKTLKFVKPKPTETKQVDVKSMGNQLDSPAKNQSTPQHAQTRKSDEPQTIKSPPRQAGSDNFHISDNSSIFKNNMSEHYARMMSQNLRPHAVIKFEIYVDEVIGTQVIEICDKAQISENVETFALKFDITNKAKIAKLKKYLKQQWKQRHDD